MADSKTSALTAVSSVTSGQEFPVNDSGTSKKATAAQIKTFVQTDLLAPGQSSGGQAAVQVQVGSGASADGNNATYGSVAVGHTATAGGAANIGAVAVGSVATATGSLSAALGVNTSATAYNAIAIGATVTCSATDTIGIGGSVSATAADAIAIGSAAQATAGQGIAIGRATSAGHAGSVCLGLGATSTATRQFVLGGDPYQDGKSLTQGYLGGGVTEATPEDFTLNATGGSGSDVAGANLGVAGGKGTGNAAGGAVIFSTSDAGASGSTLQTLTEKCRVPVEGGFQWTGNGTKPTAGSAYRGMVWYTPGGAGVLDKFEICRKDAADAYAWVSLF